MQQGRVMLAAIIPLLWASCDDDRMGDARGPGAGREQAGAEPARTNRRPGARMSGCPGGSLSLPRR
jgi:hypothetical protein